MNVLSAILKLALIAQLANAFTLSNKRAAVALAKKSADPFAGLIPATQLWGVCVRMTQAVTDAGGANIEALCSATFQTLKVEGTVPGLDGMLTATKTLDSCEAYAALYTGAEVGEKGKICGAMVAARAQAQGTPATAMIPNLVDYCASFGADEMATAPALAEACQAAAELENAETVTVQEGGAMSIAPLQPVGEKLPKPEAMKNIADKKAAAEAAAAQAQAEAETGSVIDGWLGGGGDDETESEDGEATPTSDGDDVMEAGVPEMMTDASDSGEGEEES